MSRTKEMSYDYREEVKKDKQEFVRKMLEEYDKKYQKYDHEYQFSGSASTLRTAQKYEDIVKVCELALKGLDDECHACRRRYHNGQEIIKKLRQIQEHGEETISIADAVTYIEIVSSLF